MGQPSSNFYRLSSFKLGASVVSFLSLASHTWVRRHAMDNFSRRNHLPLGPSPCQGQLHQEQTHYQTPPHLGPSPSHGQLLPGARSLNHSHSNGHFSHGALSRPWIRHHAKDNLPQERRPPATHAKHDLS